MQPDTEEGGLGAAGAKSLVEGGQSPPEQARSAHVRCEQGLPSQARSLSGS